MASKKLTWTGRVISILVSAMFIFSASFKFFDSPQLKEGFAHLGLPDRIAKPLGILELSCVVIYLIPQTAVIGAILLTGYLGGAILANARVGASFFSAVTFPVVMGILVWGSSYILEPRLRALIPFRKK